MNVRSHYNIGAGPKGIQFICVLLNDAVSSLHYVFWNSAMISELLACKEAVSAIPDVLC
jgi:hypothetical protein